MTNRALLAYSVVAGGIATIAGLYAAVDLPIPGLTLGEAWAGYTAACAALLGALGAAVALAVTNRKAPPIGRPEGGEQ